MAQRQLLGRKFHDCVNGMRKFFIDRGYIEVHTQSSKSILAACEDPKTIATYKYENQIWPLPQTGQMWLEHVLLDLHKEDKDITGCFTVSTSYRNEPNPEPGRHEKIFPMFEFESIGNMNDLINTEKDLLTHLGFPKKYQVMALESSSDKFDYSGDNNNNKSDVWAAKENDYKEIDYASALKKYGVSELDNEHEKMLCEDYGEVVLLKNFPIETSPFWNMKMDTNNKTANKVDVLLHGMETIGSAERSCDTFEMREMFNTISNGEYKNVLYENFGDVRVNKELEDFLKKDFFPRFGAGVGVTRMIRAMELSDLI